MSQDGEVECGAGVTLRRRVPCTMSDGVVLYADHYYPPSRGTYPTLLMRQPYGRDIASTVVYAHPSWFALHGYNVVIQDVRGRGDSEGDFYPFRHEGRDGAETIAFIRRLPEADGRVGMYGFSYQGMTQLLAAAENPEGLCCIAPAMTAHDLYHGWFYHHGALRLASTLGWGLQMLKEDARRRGLHEASRQLEQAWLSLPSQYLEAPYADNSAIRSEELPSYLHDWIRETTPGDFWSTMDISQSLHKVSVPALHISGWYDTYLKGSIDAYVAMREGAGTMRARQNQYLVAGPWIHIPWADRAGQHHFGSNSAIDTDDLLLRWLNHWLKDSNEFAQEPRVRHFALNDNRWYSTDVWPALNHALYLHSDGRANSSKGEGLLSTIAATKLEPPDVFVYDPEVPVVAPGGITANAGPADQSVLELGNNVLVYTTAPLAEPLHVFGHPEVSLFCATSAASSDIVAKLVRVDESGNTTFVCIGIARSSHLFGAAYKADKAMIWNFKLEPTSCVFARNDRLRLEIASSSFPLYDRNPANETAPRFAHSWNWKRSTQTIFHDFQRPSALLLPCVRPDQERT